MIVAFTAAIGLTDPVRPPSVIDPDVRYVCFSDQRPPAPYEWVEVARSETPMLDARRIKILANHPRLQSATLTLWHDSSYVLQRDLRWLVKGLAQADLIAMRHPRRVRIDDEALAIARYGYVTPDQAKAHVARYRDAGFVDQGVLTASGLLGRRVSPAVARFNAIWWQEAQQWAGRDQGSVDYAIWVSGIAAMHIPGTVRTNRYAAWRPPATFVLPAFAGTATC